MAKEKIIDTLEIVERTDASPLRLTMRIASDSEELGLYKVHFETFVLAESEGGALQQAQCVLDAGGFAWSSAERIPFGIRSYAGMSF